MNPYIIHNNGDFDSQIQTCLLATEADRPAWVDAGYEPERCTDASCPWHGTDTVITAWVDSLEPGTFPENLSITTRDLEDAHATLTGLCAPAVMIDEVPHYSLPPDPATLEYEAVLAEKIDQIESLRELLTNSLAELERVTPLIEAAYALEKEADYLHPFSAAVSDKLSGFRAAVLKYKSVDTAAQKS